MRIHKIDSSRLLKGDMHFNASICSHHGRMLMAYRLEDRTAKSWSQIALCELDSDWQPISESNRLLKIPEPYPGTNLFEDPRLYSISEGVLALTFIAACFNGKQHVAAQGTGFVLLESDEVRIPFYPEIGFNLNYASTGNTSKLKGEKNWTIINRIEGNADVLYSINPTSVYCKCSRIAHSKPDIRWSHGKLSGSTPLIPWKGKLLGCFHSFIMGPGGHRYYHAGWYVLDPETWRIISYSEQPTLSGEIDEDDKRPRGSKWVPRAVFPCGLVNMGGEIALSYGWLDSTCRIAFFTEKEIEESLVQVEKWYREIDCINNPWGGVPGGFSCRVEDKYLKAHSWLSLLKEAKRQGVRESELHEVLCVDLDPIYKKKEWVELG